MEVQNVQQIEISVPMTKLSPNTSTRRRRREFIAPKNVAGALTSSYSIGSGWGTSCPAWLA